MFGGCLKEDGIDAMLAKEGRSVLSVCAEKKEFCVSMFF